MEYLSRIKLPAEAQYIMQIKIELVVLQEL